MNKTDSKIVLELLKTQSEREIIGFERDDEKKWY
jgi:hypothetical protein